MSGIRTGLMPEYTMADIDRKVEAWRRDREKKMFEVLSYVGIESVNFAKKNGSYQDQTGNLRASVGYAVIVDGEVRKSQTVPEESASLIDELANRFNRGMVLVVVAGMEYAAAVESKGYDVITGSSFEGDRLLTFMREKLGAMPS